MQWKQHIKTDHIIKSIAIYPSGGEMISKWTGDRTNIELVFILQTVSDGVLILNLLSFATEQVSELLPYASLWTVLRECKLILILACLSKTGL